MVESKQEEPTREGGASEFWKEWALALEGVQTQKIHCAVFFSLGK